MCEKQQDYFVDFSKTNLQAMCEKQGLPPPPPMPSPVGTVSSLSMTNLARSYIIVCCHANHIFQLLPCCSIIPESHPTIPLPGWEGSDRGRGCGVRLWNDAATRQELKYVVSMATYNDISPCKVGH